MSHAGRLVLFAAAIGVAAAALAVAGSTGIAAPSAPAARYHLVFTSDRDGDEDVYAVGPSGGRLAALTRNGVDDSSVLVAPSGAFYTYREGGGFLVSADGRRERRLGPVLFNAAFSADGRLLAYEPDIASERIAIVPVAGGPVRRLVRGAPAMFSRDGRYLGIVVDGPSPALVDLRTGQRRLLPQPADENWRWSPNLTWLAYDSENDLTVVGGRSRARPRLIREASGGDWIDDGHIGLVRDRGDRKKELVVVDVKSGSEHLVASGEIGDHIAWSPTGDAVAFVRGGHLLVVAPFRGKEISVDLGPRLASLLTWSRNGRKLAVDLTNGLHVLELGPPRRLRRVAGRQQWELAWSPDDRWLAIRQKNGVTIARADGTGRPAYVHLGGFPDGITWARGPVPLQAPKAAGPPQLDTRSKPVHGALPRSGTLVSFPGSATSFAQDGDRLAWVRNAPSLNARFPSVVEVLDFRQRTRTVVGGVRRDPSKDDPRLTLAGFALAGTRVLLVNWESPCSLSTCSYGVLSASLSDRRLRGVDGIAYERDQGAQLNPFDDLRVLAAGDGGTLAYYRRCLECVGARSMIRRLERRPADIVEAVFPTALAAAAGRIVIAEQSLPARSPRPTTTISLRSAKGGKLIQQYTVQGKVESLALSPSAVAALVRDTFMLHLDARDAQTGRRIRTVPLPGASSLAIAGDRVVFHTGRTIHVLDVRTGRRSVVARAASPPIGLSLEGTRVAWAENTETSGRIRAVTLGPG
jgi:hypothetical protein